MPIFPKRIRLVSRTPYSVKITTSPGDWSWSVIGRLELVCDRCLCKRVWETISINRGLETAQFSPLIVVLEKRQNTSSLSHWRQLTVTRADSYRKPDLVPISLPTVTGNQTSVLSHCRQLSVTRPWSSLTTDSYR